VADILGYVFKKIRRIAKQYGCKTLNDLLVATAGDMGTVFEEIRSDSELELVREKYFTQGERIFGNLHNELGAADLAITVKRLSQKKWEPPYVSIIDCRGAKLSRAYFSKWHELSHLLTLTPQMRLVFRRTHATAMADPEESLMEIIASEVGFFRDFFPEVLFRDVSFENIDRIRSEFCPDASYQASLIGIVKALPVACVLLEARNALKKSEEVKCAQLSLEIEGCSRPPSPELRAVHVTSNPAARERGMLIHKNWRVPGKSVIRRVFEEGGYQESIENLNWWRAGADDRLDNCVVKIKAKKSHDSVCAIVVPIRSIA
jgi:hypothetical protein